MRSLPALARARESQRCGAKGHHGGLFLALARGCRGLGPCTSHTHWCKESRTLGWAPQWACGRKKPTWPTSQGDGDCLASSCRTPCASCIANKNAKSSAHSDKKARGGTGFRARSRSTNNGTGGPCPSLGSALLLGGFTFGQGFPWGDRDGHWYFSAYISLATFLGFWKILGQLTGLTQITCPSLWPGAKPESHAQACGPVMGGGAGG